MQPRFHRLVLMLTLAVFFVGCSKETEVYTEKAKRRTVISNISVTGLIKPHTEVPIAPDVSGEVTELAVEEGQYVKTGDLLFVIRPENFQSALEQARAAENAARADYANAQAAVTQAKATLLQDSINQERNRELYDKKAITEAEWEQAQLRFKLSKAALSSAKQAEQAAFYRIQNATASVRQAAESLRQTRVYATMDGTVTNLKIKVGQRVVGTGMMSGTEVMKIADLRDMVVEVEVTENEVVEINLGDSVKVEVDAFRDKTFSGEVIEIGFSPTSSELLDQAGANSDQVTSYPVKVRIKPSSYKDMMKKIGEQNIAPFRPGMSAVATIYTAKAVDQVTIPIQAVTLERLEGEEGQDKDPKEIVFVFDEKTSTVESRPVKTGISDDMYIVIKSGINANQEVVTGPYATVTKTLRSDMQVVKVDPEQEKFKAKGKPE